MGDWPYVIVAYRMNKHAAFEMVTTCEGDHELYRFDSVDDLHAALDYVFLWHNEYVRHLAGINHDDVEAACTVDARFRGPYEG